MIFVTALLSIQVEVRVLPTSHAAALQAYLSKNQGCAFLSENQMDKGDLQFFKESFGKKLHPFYLAGDFNQDGRKDFAAIVARGGPRAETGEPLRVVVWNGQRGGIYRVAFEKGVNAPLRCFLNLTSEKKRRVYFGVLENDGEGFILTPAGRGYVAEYDNS